MDVTIKSLDKTIVSLLQKRIDSKTKPIGALGRLEELALQMGLVQQTTHPTLCNPHILVFAADHGIARDGVSAYPQDVTWQMVMNFVRGGAAINVFCKQQGITLKVVDAGVNYDFRNHPAIIHQKINIGTKSYLYEPAMSAEECERALTAGAELVISVFKTGCNVIGFGEMGIGNTSSASVLMSMLLNKDLKECVGKGTGLDNEGVRKKYQLLAKAIEVNGKPKDVLQVLQTYGGFEIAQMVGAMLKAAELDMLVLVDGFIASSAMLVASKLQSNVLAYAVFCHQSEEAGHRLLLEGLNAKPLLHLNMRLGEGSGVAVAYPILKSAELFLSDMASFESAGVSGKTEAV
jgi:nicotinate-nucleotide--dimethylbenzimidazole phosphoribosyltransferase